MLHLWAKLWWGYEIYERSQNNNFNKFKLLLWELSAVTLNTTNGLGSWFSGRFSRLLPDPASPVSKAAGWLCQCKSKAHSRSKSLSAKLLFSESIPARKSRAVTNRQIILLRFPPRFLEALHFLIKSIPLGTTRLSNPNVRYNACQRDLSGGLSAK